MSRDPQLARAVWRPLELVHDVTYFAPEARARFGEAGYRGFWMGYFAARSAPLGAVGPEIVGALFYNFAPAHVARALPDAWSIAGPDTALTARLEGAVTALRSILGDTNDEAVSTAAALARRAAESAPPEGRALFAANGTLPWPAEPLAVLWHAATLLREHRGDGHVAALTAAGVSGREANVLASAAGGVPRALLSKARRYDDAEWDAVVATLAGRGLLEPDGSVTDEGRALRDDIEATTDRIALSAYGSLADEEIAALLGALRPIAATILATGAIPPETPMGERPSGELIDPGGAPA